METNKTLNCGVKFCGGCNPRYERMEALEKIKQLFSGKVKFDYAKEDTAYDFILIIGGCTNCCASYEQYQTKKGVIKIRETSCISRMTPEIEKIIKAEEQIIGLEENL